MSRRPLRTLTTVLLGVVLALGMTLSAVQAIDMAAKMAMASGTGDNGPDGCGACGAGDDGKMSAGKCMPTCNASGPALLSSGFVTTATDATVPPVPGVRLSHGRVASPDPYPPRPTDLV